MSLPVPQPPQLPFLANAFDIDPENSVASINHLAAKYGPIFKLSVYGSDRCFLNTVELVDEMCDEKRFHKSVSGGMEEVRNGLGNGLFTAYHGEHAWGVAHRALVPAFGPLRIGGMFDEMHDLAAQLVTRWARMEDEPINVTDDYTRLTLDSIALCAMDKRFNSFYSQTLHPFVTAMSDFLLESGKRARMTSIQKLLNRSGDRKYQADVDTMRKVAQEVVDHRRANPSDKKDLLNALLLGQDPKTGEKMTDDSIMNNMLTFLIAGHETTAGMLAFATYYLLKNPRAAKIAQREVDEVVGKGAIRLEHVSKLPYIEAILRESLRLEPTVAGNFVIAHDKVNPTILAGKYLVPAGTVLQANFRAMGRDREVFGDDAEDFKPERMYGENFTKLPRNAWKPFGNGERGCIGRSFAWQEAILALALILQTFNLRLDDPAYDLKIKQTLTVKPAGLLMRVSLREGVNTMGLEKKLFAGAEGVSHEIPSKVSKEEAPGNLKPMTAVYGSNSGTCEGLAQSLAKNALSHGFEVKVSSMDEAVEHVSGDQPLVVITASYEGGPTDNAKAFIEWLKSSPPALKDIPYAVFGCGHKDWVQTYQQIPIFVDHQLESCGATRIANLGATNVADGRIFDDFDDWQDQELWAKLTENKVSSNVTESLDVDFGTTSCGSDLGYGVKEAIVISNDLLTTTGASEKRHIELKLPSDMSYEPGDYLAVLPRNNADVVNRVLTHFKLPWDSVMTVNSRSSFPVGKELSISNALARYVELNIPATQKNLATIAAYAPAEMKERIVSQHGGQTPSILEVVEANPGVELPFSVYLAMLTPMRIRQYSISSSPLVDPSRASITISVANADSKHPGVATTYLRRCQSGSHIQVAVRKSSSFRLPTDKKTPVIMICAGSGLASFRGFVQDRVTKIKSGVTDFGQALLFVGCRDPAQDHLFKEEFDKAEKLGAVKMYHAFSRATDNSNGCKYVQDRLFHERELVRELFRQDAKVYICGSSALGKGITETAARIKVESAKEKGEVESLESAKKWWQGLRNDRYTVDVFA